MRIASIDIGTNTLRLLIGELSESGSLEKLHIQRVITRLGAGFSENNGVAESGKAKDEQKDQMRNIAHEIRVEIELGVKNIFNTWLGLQGFAPAEVKMLWADMTAITEIDKAEIEQLYAVCPVTVGNTSHQFDWYFPVISFP